VQLFTSLNTVYKQSVVWLGASENHDEDQLSWETMVPGQRHAPVHPEPVAVCLNLQQMYPVADCCSSLICYWRVTMATAKVFAASNVRSGLTCHSALMWKWHPRATSSTCFSNIKLVSRTTPSSLMDSAKSMRVRETSILYLWTAEAVAAVCACQTRRLRFYQDLRTRLFRRTILTHQRHN